jgi:hypothetical protein
VCWQPQCSRSWRLCCSAAMSGPGSPATA